MPRALQAAACSGFTAVSVRGDPRVGQSSTSQPGGSERVLACYSHLHPEQESSGVAAGVGHAAPAPDCSPSMTAQPANAHDHC